MVYWPRVAIVIIITEEKEMVKSPVEVALPAMGDV